MSAFREASKLVLFKVMRLVTEQQTEHHAFRFVYHRTLVEIKDELQRNIQDSEILYAAIYSAMFGSKEHPKASLELFTNAVDAVIRGASLSNMSILVQNRDYTELPEVVNIIVK